MRHEPVCLTPQTPGNSQLLYFTSSSLTCDDRHLVFINDRTGHPNIWTLDMETGEERQFSRNEEGTLLSYVYFDGTPRRGLGKASISLDSLHGRVYFLQGHDLCVADLSGGLRTLARLPDDQVTAFTHVSGDGARLCVPTTDARAFETDTGDIDAQVQREGLSSYLRIFSTQTGSEDACVPVPRGWVTHVQFHPTNPDLILYNHEWPSDCGIRRMWLWDGKEHIRLRDEGEGRSREDWTCHEMWTRDGQHVIYHGKYRDETAYLGRFAPITGRIQEVRFPLGFDSYGHFTVGAGEALVSDGYYREDEDERRWHGEWISLQNVDWERGEIEWIPLCRHSSDWDSQDSHPHPIFNHRGDTVFFTSNRNGRRQIFRVDA